MVILRNFVQGIWKAGNFQRKTPAKERDWVLDALRKLLFKCKAEVLESGAADGTWEEFRLLG